MWLYTWCQSVRAVREVTSTYNCSHRSRSKCKYDFPCNLHLCKWRSIQYCHIRTYSQL